MKSTGFISRLLPIVALLTPAATAQREIKPRTWPRVTVEGHQVTYQRGDFNYTRQLHDLNGDGLCDIWCSLFGVDAANLNRDADPDGDGVTNFQEMILMRDPNASEESPEVLAERAAQAPAASKTLPPTLAEMMNNPELRERCIKAIEFMERSREKIQGLHFRDRQKQRQSNRDLAEAMKIQDQKDAALMREHTRNLHPGLKEKGVYVHRIDKKGKPVLMQYDSVPIADAVKACALWPMGTSPLLDTTGRHATSVGVWDQGLAWNPHVDFSPYPGQNDNLPPGQSPVASRIIAGNTNAELIDEGFGVGTTIFYFPHATNVTGCLIGKRPMSTNNPSTPIGVAYETQVVSYGSRNDYSEMLAAAANGMKFSNHSYGPPVGFGLAPRTVGSPPELFWLGPITIPGEDPTLPIEDPEFGCYSAESKRIDAVLYETMTYLSVHSAANEAYDLGPNSIPSGVPEYGPGYQYLVRQDLDGDGLFDYAYKPRPNDGGNPEEGAYPIPSHPDAPTDEGATPMGLANDTLKTTSSAKNNITVGSMELFSGPAEFISSFRISTFSSRGPTDDGRIKPDLMAQGSDIYTSGYDNGFSTSPRQTVNGTSFSTPAVTGTLALLESLNNELNGPEYLGSSWKALLLNTATDVTTLPPYLGTAAQSADLTGPDYFHGWGMVNAEKAAEVLFRNLVGRSSGEHLRDFTLHDDETIEIPFEHDGTSPEIRVMICWTDPPYQSSAIAGLDDDVFDPETQLADSDLVERRLMNDLDMRVITPGGETLFPWVLDPASPLSTATTGDNTRDNVEQIVIDTPVAGRYTLKINHKNDLKAVERIKPGEPGYLIDGSGHEIPMFRLESEREQAVSVCIAGNRELFPRLPRITSFVVGTNVTLAQVEAILGVPYQIEYSDDAVTWVPATGSSTYPSQFIAEDFPQEIGINPGINNSSDKRFFRIRQIPTLE